MNGRVETWSSRESQLGLACAIGRRTDRPCGPCWSLDAAMPGPARVDGAVVVNLASLWAGPLAADTPRPTRGAGDQRGEHGATRRGTAAPRRSSSRCTGGANRSRSTCARSRAATSCAGCSRRSTSSSRAHVRVRCARWASTPTSSSLRTVRRSGCRSPATVGTNRTATGSGSATTQRRPAGSSVGSAARRPSSRDAVADPFAGLTAAATIVQLLAVPWTMGRRRRPLTGRRVGCAAAGATLRRLESARPARRPRPRSTPGAHCRSAVTPTPCSPSSGSTSERLGSMLGTVGSTRTRRRRRVNGPTPTDRRSRSGMGASR